MVQTKTRPAAVGGFVWHPDQDDVFDGDKYGSITLGDAPYSAFNKLDANGLTVKGLGATLTLAPEVLGDNVVTYWAKSSGALPFGDYTTNFIIEEGATLVFRPASPAISIGAIYICYGDGYPVLRTHFQLDGSLIIQDTGVDGGATAGEPGTTIDISTGGKFVVNQTNPKGEVLFADMFYINVQDQGLASITATTVSLLGGAYVTYGNPPSGNPSFAMTAVFIATSPQSGRMDLANLQILSRQASASRLKSRFASYNNTDVKVQDTASILIACDEFYKPFIDTTFTVAKGAGATITFTSQGGGPAASTKGEPAPFNFVDKVYPAGLFNFLTANPSNPTDNTGQFRFLGAGNAFWLAGLQATGSVTVNGVPNKNVVEWRNVADQNDPSKVYFTILLKQH